MSILLVWGHRTPTDVTTQWPMKSYKNLLGRIKYLQINQSNLS